METMTLVKGGPITRAERDAIPDDGRRYELIDGVLVVTPAPSFHHQGVVGELYLLLRASCPPGLVVLFAPFDVALADDTVVEPDLLVAPRAAFTDKELPTAPLLAVEVLSRSTRRFDLGLKKDRYAEAGILHYWVVDPLAPSMTAWELRDGVYAEVGSTAGEESLDLASPFPVTVVPSRLLQL